MMGRTISHGRVHRFRATAASRVEVGSGNPWSAWSPLLTEGSLTFDPVSEGARIRWSWEVETRGVLRLLCPLVARMGRRQELKIWTNLKQPLEARPKL